MFWNKKEVESEKEESRIPWIELNLIEQLDQIKSDSKMHRHMICPSIFPGNDWSERKGWVSNQGFLIAYNNGTDKPEVIISPI